VRAVRDMANNVTSTDLSRYIHTLSQKVRSGKAQYMRRLGIASKLQTLQSDFINKSTELHSLIAESGIASVAVTDSLAEAIQAFIRDIHSIRVEFPDHRFEQTVHQTQSAMNEWQNSVIHSLSMDRRLGIDKAKIFVSLANQRKGQRISFLEQLLEDISKQTRYASHLTSRAVSQIERGIVLSSNVSSSIRQNIQENSRMIGDRLVGLGKKTQEFERKNIERVSDLVLRLDGLLGIFDRTRSVLDKVRVIIPIPPMSDFKQFIMDSSNSQTRFESNWERLLNDY
jgi:hypothetical protein